MSEETKKNTLEEKKGNDPTKEIKIDPNANVLEFSAVLHLVNVDVVASSNPENIKNHSSGNTNNVDASITNITDLSKFIERSSKSDLLEAQVKLVTLFVTEAKFLESEMNKLIRALYGKHPESKPYFLKMKKLLQDHANIQKALDDVKKAS